MVRARAHLRERVGESVRLVLDHHRRHLVPGGAVALGMQAVRHAEETGKGQAARCVGAIVHRAVQRFGDAGVRGMGHLLDPDRDRGVGQPRSHREARMAERDAARSARAFHLGAGNAAEPDGLADESRQHLLAGEHPGDEVAQIQRADALGLDAGVGQRVARGVCGQIIDRRRVVAAEAGRADSENGYVSHCNSPPSPVDSLLDRCIRTAAYVHSHRSRIDGSASSSRRHRIRNPDRSATIVRHGTPQGHPPGLP